MSASSPSGPLVYLSHGLVRVCEIEVSHMGKMNGNLNLVNEIKFSHSMKRRNQFHTICNKHIILNSKAIVNLVQSTRRTMHVAICYVG